MRKQFSKIMAALLAVLVAFSMVIIDTETASAKSSWDVYLNNYAFVGQQETVYAGNGDDSATVTSVKSGNSKIIKVKKSKFEGVTYYDLKYKKTGKTKVTVKFKTPSGEVFTKTKTIKVLKYPNHIKSIKINGKSVNVKKNKYYFDKKVKGTSVNIKMATKNGWKISYADINMSGKNNEKEVKNSKSKIKKGTTIKFPKGYDYLSAWVEMSKGNKYITYQVFLYR